jgi:hypothetical protein
LKLIQESTTLQDMDYDESKVDQMTLALMFLTSFTDHGSTRSWKGYDWDVMERLHKAGLIYDPVGKAKSIVLTEEGEKLSRELFQKFFARPS